MKQGEEIQCPYCGKKTFVIKKTLMKEWINMGEIFACSVCDAKIADIEEQKKDNDNKPFDKSELSDFLGIEAETKKEFIVSEEEKQFCRDCKHYIEHPFLSRCSLFDKKVSPMDDCPKWQQVKSSK